MGRTTSGLGLSELRQFIRRMQAYGYSIDAQARDSRTSIALGGMGVYPIYHEKDQAGLLSRIRMAARSIAPGIPARSIPTSVRPSFDREHAALYREPRDPRPAPPLSQSRH